MSKRAVKKTLSLLLMAVLIIGLLPGMASALATTGKLVEPWELDGNDPDLATVRSTYGPPKADCKWLYSFKIDLGYERGGASSFPLNTPVMFSVGDNSTSYSAETGAPNAPFSVYITRTGDDTFDFSSASSPVFHVFVKSGPGGYLFRYWNPAGTPHFSNGVVADTGLYSPTSGWSHITFYYCGSSTGSITVEKYDDATKASLAGATFELWLGATKLYTQTLTGSTHTWTGLAAGDYTVVETVAPPGYQLANPASQTVTLSETNNMVGSATFKFYNPQIPGSVTVYKKDAAGTTGLQGATFSLTGTNYSDQQTLTNTDTYTWTDLVHGVYTLTEVAPPPGYNLDSPASVTLTVGPGNIDVSYTYKNTPKPGSITVRKFKLDGTTGLAGATFRLSQGAVQIGSDVTLTGHTHTWSGLEYGEYTVTEISPPPGHQLASQVSQTVTVGASTPTVTVDFENPETLGSITVRKFKMDGTTGLTGATFRLTKGTVQIGNDVTLTQPTHTWFGLAHGEYTVTEISAPPGHQLANPVSQTVTVGPPTTETLNVTVDFLNPETDKGSITVRKFNATGTAGLTGATFRLSQGTNVLSTVTMSSSTYTWPGLDYGTYIVTEISPPPGYSLGSPASQTVTIGSEVANVTVSYYNTPNYVLGSITVRKFEVTGTTGLTGATFELWQGTTLVDTRTLSGSTYTWGNLAAGTYTVVEKVAPPGYQIADPDRQTVTLSESGNMVGSATFDFKNTPVITPGSITVRKFEATGTTGLAGATFELWLGTTKLDTQTLTGSTYTWTDLAAGTYTVTETVAPPGYQLANPASQTITLSESGGMVGSATFDFKNTPILGNLRVIKFLRDDDVITGLAGATFALYKPDMNGIKIDERVLDTDEYTWFDLEPGTYTVVEVAAPPRPDADQQFELADPITVQVPGGATVTVEVYNELPRTGLEYGGHLISGLSMILLGLGVRRRLL